MASSKTEDLKNSIKNPPRKHKIPDMRTKFEVAHNPMENHPLVAQWIDQCFEYSCMDVNKYSMVSATTMFPSLFYPLCTDIKRFEVVVKIWLIFAILDDHSEAKWGDVAMDAQMARQFWGKAIELNKRFVDNDQTVALHNLKPYLLYWYVHLDQMFTNMDTTSKKRICKELNDYYAANISESEKFGKKNELNTFEEMYQVRKYVGGVYPSFAFLLYTQDIRISDTEWDSPLFKDYIDKANKCILYHNDIVSLEKELNQHNNKPEQCSNVVAFTSICYKLSIEESLKLVCQQYYDVEKDAMKAKKKLLASGVSKDVEMFAKCVSYMIGGNFRAGYLTSRYYINE